MLIILTVKDYNSHLQGHLEGQALQVFPPKPEIRTGKWTEISFRNKSLKQAMIVLLDFESSQAAQIQFRSPTFVIEPNGKYTNGVLYTGKSSINAKITASASGGKGQQYELAIPFQCDQ